MSREKWLVLLGVALAVLLADQISKAMVVAFLDPYEVWAPFEVLSPYFTIVHVTNTGAAFGILPEGGTFFMIVALIVVVIIIYFYRQLPEKFWLVRVALGLQLGGALGNLMDRVRLGYVIDFLDFKLSPALGWPVFNVADSGIVIGVGLLLLLMWREDRRQASARAAADSSDSVPPDDEPSSVAPP